MLRRGSRALGTKTLPDHVGGSRARAPRAPGAHSRERSLVPAGIPAADGPVAPLTSSPTGCVTDPLPCRWDPARPGNGYRPATDSRPPPAAPPWTDGSGRPPGRSRLGRPSRRTPRCFRAHVEHVSTSAIRWRRRWSADRHHRAPVHRARQPALVGPIRLAREGSRPLAAHRCGPTDGEPSRRPLGNPRRGLPVHLVRPHRPTGSASETPVPVAPGSVREGSSAATPTARSAAFPGPRCGGASRSAAPTGSGPSGADEVGFGSPRQPGRKGGSVVGCRGLA